MAILKKLFRKSSSGHSPRTPGDHYTRKDFHVDPYNKGGSSVVGKKSKPNKIGPVRKWARDFRGASVPALKKQRTKEYMRGGKIRSEANRIDSEWRKSLVPKAKAFRSNKQGGHHEWKREKRLENRVRLNTASRIPAPGSPRGVTRRELGGSTKRGQNKLSGGAYSANKASFKVTDRLYTAAIRNRDKARAEAAMAGTAAAIGGTAYGTYKYQKKKQTALAGRGQVTEFSIFRGNVARRRVRILLKKTARKGKKTANKIPGAQKTKARVKKVISKLPPEVRAGAAVGALVPIPGGMTGGATLGGLALAKNTIERAVRKKTGRPYRLFSSCFSSDEITILQEAMNLGRSLTFR